MFVFKIFSYSERNDRQIHAIILKHFNNLNNNKY